MLIVDESRTILIANPVAETIFDVQENGLPGRLIEYSMASGDTKELNVRSRDEKTVSVEMRMVVIARDGKPAVFISLTTFPNTSGTITNSASSTVPSWRTRAW